MSQKSKSSLFISYFFISIVHLQSGNKAKTFWGEQIKAGENRSKTRSAAHWAGGPAHITGVAHWVGCATHTARKPENCQNLLQSPRTHGFVLLQVGRASNAVFYPSLMIVWWCVLHGDCLNKSNPTIWNTSKKPVARVLTDCFATKFTQLPHFSLIPLFAKFPLPHKFTNPLSQIPFSKLSNVKTQTLILHKTPKTSHISLTKIYPNSP